MTKEDLANFDFTLPDHLVRKVGVEPRDSAKLFVYDTASDTISHDVFKNLGKYLPASATLIFNETRVLPVRLWLTKETGGKIEVFVLTNEWEGDQSCIPVLADRRLELGQKLFCGPDIVFSVESQDENRFFLRLMEKKRALEDILLKYGTTPIPPYLKENNQSEEILRKRYQTVFAQKGSSVAAPTASLHFTGDLLKDLEHRGVRKVNVSLEVGLGTFAPLKEENFKTSALHTERITFAGDFLEEMNGISREKLFIPVGTTSLRALETFALRNISEPGTYKTDIFITPGFHFQKANGLITNFHIPRSSLILLVEAFLQHKKARRGVIELYNEAIKKEYAFYSFGDAMLIL